jgi:DNA-binding winged helix-turn-helix (wHTH) protein
MPDAASPVIAFGPFRLFPAERRLEKDGAPVTLGGRALDLLVYLAERAGEVVPNRVLMRAVWRDMSIEDSNLRFHIKNLRKTLGAHGPDIQYVTNVPGRGYCFVGPIKQLVRASASKPHGAPLGTRANLPERAGAIIGRSASIGIVSRELMQRRLVTIAGPAGIGKTTLAIATAATLRRSFDDAVFFVDLAPIEEPALVFSALSSVLGGVAGAEDSVASITDFLRGKRFLIVLDNCEFAPAFGRP